jgi:hypothetical protein
MTKFIEKVNNYYNTTKTNIIKKMDIGKNYDFNFVEENNMNIVELYLDKKLKVRAEYNIIGLYNVPLSVWYWSWNIAFINKNVIKDVNKLKNFANTLNTNYDKFDMKEAEELYYLFSNDNFYISGSNIDKLIKIVLYLMNGVWILPINHNNGKTMDRIEYIIISKIIQNF